MKRIVQCPKCQAKLAVFDLGKPINQKCPKCSESFVIESEEGKAGDAAKPAATAAPAAAAAETKDPAMPAVKPEKPADVKSEPQAAGKTESPAEAKKDVKEEPKVTPKPEVPAAAAPKPAPKTAAPRPVPSMDQEPELPVPHSGVSFLHIVVIIGLLILVIAMQVMAKKNAERRFNSLEAQISDMHKALSAQIIKSK